MKLRSELAFGSAESLGTKVIEKYIENRKSLPFKIDPTEVGDSLFGLSFDFADMPDDTLGIFSPFPSAYFESSTNTVYITSPERILLSSSLKNNKARLHFTAAHELAHYIIHRMKENLTIRGALPYEYDEEIYANRLAAAILMPADMVKRNMFFLGMKEKIPVLDRSLFPGEYAKIEMLADMMEVSMTALICRLRFLGIIEERYIGEKD